MRLWSEQLIPYLDNQRLLSQHRECAALRGNGWGKKHATVNYVFDHSPAMLYSYHIRVMEEMQKRSYKVDLLWTNPYYRGKNCNPYITDHELWINDISYDDHEYIYPEHTKQYLELCIQNLRSKGIDVTNLINNLQKEGVL